MDDLYQQAEHAHAVDRRAHMLDDQVLHGRPPNVGRPAAWSILFGSAFYFVVLTVEGLLRPGYHPASMFISELALGPRGWVQNTNFMVFGLSILVFALGVALEFGTSRPARIGVTLLAIIGISMAASGLFVIDPVSTSGLVIEPVEIIPRMASFHSKFHYVLGTMSFLLAPVSCFCFVVADRLSKDPAWQAFRRCSLALAIAMLLGLILLKVSTLPHAPAPLRPWSGLIQRAMVLPFIVWLFSFGLLLLRRSREAGRSANIDGATKSAAS